MRRGHIVAASIAMAIAALITLGVNQFWVNPSFATTAYVRFHYGGKAIDAQITDARDVGALKDILRGFSLPDEPSCGFDADIAITLTDGHRGITFCPACDACGTYRVGNTNRYIESSDAQRRRFEAIVKKYGMTFPCE